MKKKRQVIEKITKVNINIKRLALFSVTIVFSAALLSAFLTSRLSQRSPDASTKVLAENTPTLKTLDNTPVRILIPNENIDLPIQAAPVVKDTWQVYENAAGLGANTAKNNKFYLLGNAKWQTFEVIDKSYILPEDINTVLKTDNAKLTTTLFSCDGPNDEKRVVIKAILSDHSEGGDI